MTDEDPKIRTELETHPLMRLLWWCYVLCMVAMAVIFGTILWKLDMSSLGGQTFAVRLLQATLGMLIGVTFAIMGVVAVVLGLVEATKVEVSGWGKAALTGPGGLLVVCGTLIICMCLMREFSITKREGGADLQDIDYVNQFDEIQPGP
jgi:hypothetical protein